jgi:flagellar protein FlgJ
VNANQFTLQILCGRPNSQWIGRMEINMSISIGNNLNFNNITSVLDASKNTNKLDEQLSNTENMNDEELKEVCKSFETYFVEQMFKEMRKTVHSSDEENEYMSYFGDMLYQDYAGKIAENNGIGIAKMLYESMKRN